jgi:hypothetical protein
MLQDMSIKFQRLKQEEKKNAKNNEKILSEEEAIEM